MKNRAALLSISGIAFGGAGALFCTAGLVLLWVMSVRLERKAESLYDKMDHALEVIRHRVVVMRDRIAEAAITADDLKQSLANLATRAAVEISASRIEESEHIQRLVFTLEESEKWLEVSETTLKLIQEIESLSSDHMASANADRMEGLLADISLLQIQLAEAARFASDIAAGIARFTDEQRRGGQFRKVERLAVLLVEKVASVSDHLENVSDRCSKAQVGTQELKSKTRGWFLLGTTGVSILIAWMGSGQIALCVLAWHRWR